MKNQKIISLLLVMLIILGSLPTSVLGASTLHKWKQHEVHIEDIITFDPWSSLPMKIGEKRTKGAYIKDVTSEDQFMYPNDDEKDGFWYVYQGSTIINDPPIIPPDSPKTQADEYNGVPTTVITEQSTVSDKPIQDAIPNLPQGSIITIINRPVGRIYVPILKELEVEKGKTVDLLSAVTNPEDGIINSEKTSVDTNIAGEQTGVITTTIPEETKNAQVEVKFSDGSKKRLLVPVVFKSRSTDYDVTVNVVEPPVTLTNAETFTPIPKKEILLDKCAEVEAIDLIEKFIAGEGIDTDGDGLSDSYEETVSRTRSLNYDSDLDGLGDGFEIFISKTYPKISDTDSDGSLDGIEFYNGRNPKIFGEGDGTYTVLTDFMRTLGVTTKEEVQTYLQDNPLFSPKIFQSHVNDAVIDFKSPIAICDVNTTEVIVVVTYEDGTTDEVVIPITINRTEADEFVPVVEDNIVVLQNDGINLIDKITNIPKDATAEITKPVDTTTLGEQVGEVTITFTDGSKTVVEVPVTVKMKLVPIVPIHEISVDDIITEVVTQGEAVDLTDNINNLPEGITVTPIGTVDTKEYGNKSGEVKVTFADGSSKIVEIPVTVNPKIVPIVPIHEISVDDIITEVVTQGEAVDLSDNINNLPVGTTVTPIGTVDTKEHGTKTGEVKVTFPDGSSKLVEIPVTVNPKLVPIIPIHEISKEDIITEIVTVGDPVDLTDNINNLPVGTTITPIGTVNTEIAGEKKGLVDVTFPDGSSRLVEIPVIVECKECNTEELEKELADKIQELEDLKETTDAQAQALLEQINDLEEQIKELENTVANKNDKILELETEKSSLSDQVVSLQQQLDDVNAEIEDLKNQISDLQNQLDDANAKEEANAEKIAELEGKIAKLEGQLADKEAQIKDLQDQLDDANAEIEALKKQIEALEKADDNKNELVAELQKQLEKAKQNLKECGEANVEKAKKIADLDCEIKDLKKQLEDAKKSTQPTEEKDPYADLKDDIIRLIIKAERELDRNRDLTREQQRELENAIDNGKDVLDNPRSDRHDLREAKRDLEDALDNATKKPTTTSTTQTPTTTRTNTQINKLLSNKDNNVTDFLNRVRRFIGKDMILRENTSNDSEYTTLKYVFMIGSYRFAEATNKDHTIYGMDVAPFIQNDRTMLPLRYVGYCLGAEVEWNERTRTASFSKDGVTASINIDDNKIRISDGKVYEMDSKPTMVNGRTMVSLTNVSKVYGITNGDMFDGIDHDIEWDGNDRTVTIFIQR